MDTAVDRDTSLQIRRIFRAPVEAVFAAWTQAEQLKHWFAPSDEYEVCEVLSDARVGGRFRVVMRGPDGEMHRVGGEFREVVAGRRLVYTWAWESTPERESLVTVEFAPAPEGTELVLTHQRFADIEARDQHRHGWSGCIERLARHLSR